MWSLDTSSDPSYNNFLLQPFLNYNLRGSIYINSAPIITANWEADSGDQWTVPLGAGVGRIFHLGKLPVNGQIGGYYNVVKPDDGADWQLRVQVQLMFPKWVRGGTSPDMGQTSEWRQASRCRSSPTA
jgi:hypothetical protein